MSWYIVHTTVRMPAVEAESAVEAMQQAGSWVRRLAEDYPGEVETTDMAVSLIREEE